MIRLMIILLLLSLITGGCGAAGISGDTEIIESEAVLQKGDIATDFPVHTCVWDGGNIVWAATCTEEGSITYTCSVCHAIRTESIVRASHNYIVQGTADTCEETGKGFEVCTVCGEMKEGSISDDVPGHDYRKIYAFEEPACTGGAYYNMICQRCGEYGGDGTDPAVPHSLVETVLQEGDCSTPTIIEYICDVCHAGCGSDVFYPMDAHDWVTKETLPYWSEEAQDFVTDTVTCCSRCNAASDTK